MNQLDFSMNFHIFGNMKKSIAIAALGALSQETRLDIFRYLVQLGAPGAPAGQIGEHLGLPSATLSFHLNTLKQADLVCFRREDHLPALSVILRSDSGKTVPLFLQSLTTITYNG